MANFSKMHCLRIYPSCRQQCLGKAQLSWNIRKRFTEPHPGITFSKLQFTHPLQRILFKHLPAQSRPQGFPQGCISGLPLNGMYHIQDCRSKYRARSFLSSMIISCCCNNKFNNPGYALYLRINGFMQFASMWFNSLCPENSGLACVFHPWSKLCPKPFMVVLWQNITSSEWNLCKWACKPLKNRKTVVSAVFCASPGQLFLIWM